MRGLGLAGHRRIHRPNPRSGRANRPAPPAAALDLPYPAGAAWHGTGWPAQRPRTPQAGLGRRSERACWLRMHACAAAAARRSAPRPWTCSAGRRPGSEASRSEQGRRCMRRGAARHARQQPVQLMPPCGAGLGAWRASGGPGRAWASPMPSPTQALIHCGGRPGRGTGRGPAAGHPRRVSRAAPGGVLAHDRQRVIEGRAGQRVVHRHLHEPAPHPAALSPGRRAQTRAPRSDPGSGTKPRSVQRTAHASAVGARERDARGGRTSWQTRRP